MADAGLDLAKSQQFDAVVLDLLLPEIPGMELLRQLRGAGVGTPTILLTALGSVEERVTGLQNGADDYVVKPFALVELLARLEAVCRRSGSRPSCPAPGRRCQAGVGHPQRDARRP